MSGTEALAGLILVHLHLKKLTLQSLFCIATLSHTHPLRSLVGRGTLAEAASKLPQLTEHFDMDAAKAHSGHQLMDCFVDRVKFKEVNNDQDDADKLWALESAYKHARSNLDYVMVATDASVCTNHTIQAVAAVCLLHRDELLQQFCCAVGKATALDAELFALHLGVEHACHVPGTKSIVLFTNHIAAVSMGAHPSTTLGYLYKAEVKACKDEWTRLFAIPTYTVSTYILTTNTIEMTAPWHWVDLKGTPLPSSDPINIANTETHVSSSKHDQSVSLALSIKLTRHLVHDDAKSAASSRAGSEEEDSGVSDSDLSDVSIPSSPIIVPAALLCAASHSSLRTSPPPLLHVKQARACEAHWSLDTTPKAISRTASISAYNGFKSPIPFHPFGEGFIAKAVPSSTLATFFASSSDTNDITLDITTQLQKSRPAQPHLPDLKDPSNTATKETVIVGEAAFKALEVLKYVTNFFRYHVALGWRPREKDPRFPQMGEPIYCLLTTMFESGWDCLPINSESGLMIVEVLRQYLSPPSNIPIMDSSPPPKDKGKGKKAHKSSLSFISTPLFLPSIVIGQTNSIAHINNNNMNVDKAPPTEGTLPLPQNDILFSGSPPPSNYMTPRNGNGNFKRSVGCPSSDGQAQPSKPNSKGASEMPPPISPPDCKASTKPLMEYFNKKNMSFTDAA
ncbi:hypothetical protein D9756_000878 [Leucocoprinus leucothites]|uniref:Uncharacterized protein n=1 Tax=Leucocoprinus leucothites TaxID=201217 RepID=A0A8H5GEB6_9AGAR|nr:hypothetical protein D9756_000878 [Leucoagaricus leucothites]